MEEQADTKWIHPRSDTDGRSVDDETEMVGQGLSGSIETTLEWYTDDTRGEERVLDD